MSLIRWDPMGNVSDLQTRINRLFDESYARSREVGGSLSLCSWGPAVDIFETVEGFTIKADLPGVKKEHVVVEVQDNILTIRGNREVEKDIPEDRYLRRERCSGNFQRSFSLQATVLPNRIAAKFKDGVLEIFVPKPEEETPLQVKVD